MRVASSRSPEIGPLARQPGPAQPLTGLRPEQLAFLGEYAGATQGKQVFVQLVCWPTVPAAWTTLAQSYAGLRQMRGEVAALPPIKGSWIHQIAPQLSRPVERDVATAESTLATLIRRLPVRFAAAMVEVDAGHASSTDALRYRALFSESLGAYSTHLKGANQIACRALVTLEQPPETADVRRHVYDEVLPHLTHAAHVKGMVLAAWPGAAPLPLELAQLAAAALGKHIQDPATASPLFETVRGLLVPSSRFHSTLPSRRRR